MNQEAEAQVASVLPEGTRLVSSSTEALQPSPAARCVAVYCFLGCGTTHSAKLREVSLGPYSVGVIDRILKLLYFSGSHSPGNPGPVKASERIPATGKFLKERSLLLTVEAEKSKVKGQHLQLDPWAWQPQ
ncbi:PREDICTED: uncharacterized protein LOC105596996 isoform X1 [Cercocebus atys]|uniref:uncharacterized protein LOC105596996 isoform X1 n=1 Tax=Cercocebus atys TaxID=9531 RepID=UPI0005F54D80|nr:PREDICTED: uncharacterized protein LOC105596996 isoform X1 [Cercocebus atys]